MGGGGVDPASALRQPAAAPRAAADSPPPAAPSPTPYRHFEVSIGYHYSSGDYGSSASTEIDYVPLVLTAELGRWRLQGTIPYLHINGPPGVINGPNGPIQTNGAADGLGDLLARVSYLLPTSYVLPAGYAGRWWIPYADLVGLVKFPTASRGRGLGTGEFDFGFEGELTWVIGRLTPFATAGYRFLGSPPGTHLNDVFDGSVGAAFRLLEAVSAGLLFDYRQASSATTGEQVGPGSLRLVEVPAPLAAAELCLCRPRLRQP